MWIFALLAGLGAPAPDAYVRLDCPWTPLFFNRGEAQLDAGDRDYVIGTMWDWVLRNGGDVHVVLRTYTSEKKDTELNLSRLSEARADSVRNALIGRGVRPDHVQIAHEYGEGPELVPEGANVGWVLPEFFVTRATRARLLPSGLMC